MWWLSKKVFKEFKTTLNTHLSGFKEQLILNTYRLDTLEKQRETIKKEVLDEVRSMIREPLQDVVQSEVHNKPENSIIQRFSDSVKISELKDHIKLLLHKNYRTTDIKHTIITKYGLKPTTFYKYLKIVRSELHGVNQTNSVNKPKKKQKN